MVQLTLKNACPVPATLLTKGVAATNKLCADYDAGVREFSIDKGIYGAADVKDALIQSQHYKCCFCEARIGHIDDGDIEHFRPKKAWKQGESDPLNRPGYYWLAYDWDNLFLSCTKCNQRNKGNLFPLVGDSPRALSHHDDISSELTGFIHPSSEYPEEHLTFQNASAVPVPGSIKGFLTIKYLDLNRSLLEQDRAERLNDLLSLAALVLQIPDTPKELKKEAIDKLKDMETEKTQISYPYSSMFRAYFKNNLITALP